VLVGPSKQTYERNRHLCQPLQRLGLPRNATGQIQLPDLCCRRVLFKWPGYVHRRIRHSHSNHHHIYNHQLRTSNHHQLHPRGRN
ncbi:hypothetical protein FS837_007276, partial [Tulasnella sp. UAMH 9824]